MTNKNIKPPKLAEKLIGMMVNEKTGYTAVGDFAEEFYENYDNKGYLSAVFHYYLSVLGLFPVYIIESTTWSLAMINNYLKITFRTIMRNKVFSLINIVGLALSMSICLLMVIFIRDKKESDQFHSKKDRIVRVLTSDTENGWYIDGWATSPAILGPMLKESFSFVEETVTLKRFYDNINQDNISMPVMGLFAEKSFFDIFDYSLKLGDAKLALSNPYSIIISEDAAKKFFGNTDPINKIITMGYMGDFTVTGVIETESRKSHLTIETLISLDTARLLENNGKFNDNINNWASYNSFYTYVLLEDDSDQAELEYQLPFIAKSIFPKPENEQLGFEVQHLLDISLGKNLSNRMPGVMAGIEIIAIPFLALIIIALASFNYIILSVSKSLKRAKEIGLRKVVGAKRHQVMKLFLLETFVITFIALIVSCIFLVVIIPLINSSEAVINNGFYINLEMMKQPVVYFYFLMIAVVVSLIAGLYPALYLSALKPITALQGVSRIKGFSHLLTRKILMSIQFGVSFIAIICIVYFSQTNTYWLNYDRGIKLKDTVNVLLQNVNYSTFKNEVISNSNINGVSFSATTPVYGGATFNIMLKSNEADGYKYGTTVTVDPDYFDNYELNIVAGRNFSKDILSDVERGIIINERAVKHYNLGSPEEAIGKVLDEGEYARENNRYVKKDGKYVTIKTGDLVVVGVVKDYVHETYFMRPVEAFILKYNPEKFSIAVVHYKEGKRKEVEKFLTESWNNIEKVHSIDFNFAEDIQARIDNDISGSLMFSKWACGFIVLIALFGLLGMATYTTEMRTKEIGVRKVLGGSVYGISYTLSKEYLKLIMYSAIVSIPAAYFIMEAMLSMYAFRPELNLLVLPIVLFIVTVLALLTVGSQTLKAALANPINTLRNE